MSRLFSPIALRTLELENRAWVAPMCMYSSQDGVVGDFHLVHHGGFAAGRAGLIMAEATAVVPEGRISVDCPGLWNDEQAVAWKRVVDYVHGLGGKIGIQLAHAGRKGSTRAPWIGGVATPDEGGWQTVAPSAIAFGPMPVPRTLTTADIADLVRAFADAAVRARAAGFDTVELHAAHGYLMHQFLSPLTNERTDEYGGSLENRMRFPLAVAEAVRAAWPSDLPVIARISATDWMPGGLTVEESIIFVRELAKRGIDLVDVSTAGLHPDQQIPSDPNYQVDIAARIKHETGVTISAVGLITSPQQAEAILADGKADAVRMARAFLRDPHWPLRAAAELGDEIAWIPQYSRGLPWA